MKPNATDSIVLLCSLALGCSSTLGGAGSYIVHNGDTRSLGFKAGSLVEVPLLGYEPSLAVGVETTLLQRIHDGGDEWGQWRGLGLLGLTHMPRQADGRLGYELFLTGGVARYALGDADHNFGIALGAQTGFPIRLSGGDPAWKADDVVGLAGYLVPSLGGTWMGFESLEAVASLSFRMQLWSAAIP